MRSLLCKFPKKFGNILTTTKFLQVAVTGLPLHEVIGGILKGKWDHERTEFCLPPLMNLVSKQPDLMYYLEKLLSTSRTSFFPVKPGVLKMMLSYIVPWRTWKWWILVTIDGKCCKEVANV